MAEKPKSPSQPVSAGLRLFWRLARADVAPLAPLRRELAQAAPRAQAVVRFMMLAQRETRV